jgi:hypothetical protein
LVITTNRLPIFLKLLDKNVYSVLVIQWTLCYNYITSNTPPLGEGQCPMSKTVNVEKPHSLLSQALNCVEHLLVCDEIDTDDYCVLTRVLELMNNNLLELGEDIKLQLVDTRIKNT